MISFRFNKFIILSVISVFFFFSCTKDKNKEVIGRAEFVKILIDLHIGESLMTDKGWYDAQLPDSLKSYYNYVLRKYNISRSKFDYSLAYYSRNLEDLMKIYDDVIFELNQKVPKQLNPKSFYNIISKSFDEAEMTINPVKRFGESGLELWMQKNLYNFPGDTFKTDISLEKEIKHKSLLVLKAEYMIMPNDKTRNLKMRMIVFYKDSTADTIQNKLKVKNGKWEEYHLALKTDSTKLPTKVKSTAFYTDSLNSKSFIYIRNISLKQYAPNKDTSNLFVIPKKDLKQKIFKKNKPVE